MFFFISLNYLFISNLKKQIKNIHNKKSKLNI